jgi:hypothetical protein
MTNFAGADYAPLAVSVLPFASSTDVSSASFTPGLAVNVNSSFLLGANSGNFITSSLPQNLAGLFTEIFGGQLFERIIMSPLVEALGFVITDTQFTAEPWNTSRYVGQVLTAINVSGGVGDLTVANPYPMPTFYAALESRTYQVTVSKSGAPNINETVCWIFQSGTGGTCILVTGNRVVLFSAPLDWDYGVKERISFLTNVMDAYSTAEQRRALRQLPRRGASFRAKGLNARDAAAIESQIWGWQAQPFGVPWWPDVTPLLASVAAGATALQVNTTDFQFTPGGIAAIWKDEYTYEALAITAVTPTSLTLASPLHNSWTAGPATLVMPVFLGRLADTVDIDRLFSGADQMDLEFSGEAQQVAPAPTLSLTQYKGMDVLELPAQWPSDLKRKYHRDLIHIDPSVGPITVIDKAGYAVTSQPFPWMMLNHSQVTTLRAFVLARFGRLRPFWIPTWDQDLVMYQDALNGDSGIKIKSEFYTRFMFPNNSRRYLALIPFDSSGNVYRKITSAVDNGDGTETLGFDSNLPKAFPAAKTMVCFLVFARLDADDIEIEWMNNDLAQTTLEFTEVPFEAPL